jgi:hypothetical protein
MKDQVEVVDHEVQHYSHVRAPRLEWGQSLALEVARAVQVRLRRPKRPVVPFDVTNLELDPSQPRCRDQRIGLSQGCRQRLLHEDRHAHFERPHPHLCVGGRGYGDGHRLDPCQEIVELHERCRTQLGGDSLRPGAIQVADADQVHLVQLGQMPGMMPAQRADPDDPHRES